MEDYAASLDQATGAITDNTRAMAVKALTESGAIADAKLLGLNLSLVTDTALGQADAIAEVQRQLDAMGASTIFASTATQDERDAAYNLEKQLGATGDAIAAAKVQATDSAAAMNTYAAGMNKAAIEHQELRGQVEQLPGALEPATAAIAESGAQSEEATKAIEEWRQTLASVAESFTQPLSLYETLLTRKEEAERASAQATADATEDASDSWEDHASSVTVTLAELAAELEAQNAAQEQWRDNLVDVTQRGGLEVAQILAAMGAQGAQITAEMADATDEDFTRMAEALIEDARFGGEGAVAEMDKHMRVMAEVAAAGADTTAQGIADRLGLGVVEVAEIARQYGVVLAHGINPLLAALNEPQVRPPSPGRGDWVAYADGGLREQHVAQIANPGTYRVWAEPETAGETPIPIRLSTTTRSAA